MKTKPTHPGFSQETLEAIIVLTIVYMRQQHKTHFTSVYWYHTLISVLYLSDFCSNDNNHTLK